MPELNKRIEEMSLNGWPALQTVLYDGWLLRFADGYTKRSNSINAIYGHSDNLDAKIGHCEAIYRERGLPVVFKITPFVQPEGLDARLEELGYSKIDHTLVKTTELASLKCPEADDVVLTTELTDYWLDCVASMQGLNGSQLETTRRMMADLPLQKAFAVLLNNGQPVACGIAVKEMEWVGLYDIVTDSAHRGRGYGERLMRHLLHWAKLQGASKSYVLVVQSNTAANRLYDKFGYMHIYDYWYRVKI